ncbi:hypothetical protein N7466_004098 [Penicillium verhagenii]|uniref:uncharacterized protein n=1 Tax=Penicillium verhagenii TaxID=1562060 RepID=UPI002545632B|nr:uncharacterized protein N7466_004098 [Penicillium verhagenii]KAJ5934551.1 hypothetical protein N7466_004098 [Penicillium verhagenii]
MDPSMEIDSDEYEYEYDERETESFYVNLDLTSCNGPIRPPRMRDEDSRDISAIENEPYGGPDDLPEDTTFTPLESTETATLPGERIQLLGLHTCNPVVSYHNQIFSCAWADQIGTELLFTHPDAAPDADYPPLRQGPGFELLAANSVKILGRKANITSSSGPGLVPGDINIPNPIPTNTGTPDSFPADPASMTIHPALQHPTTTHQANFIQRLQSMKNAKGQSDTVRRVMGTKKAVNFDDRLNAWARTEAQVAEITSLNQRAANGDEEALEILEMMIRDLDEANDSEEEF